MHLVIFSIVGELTIHNILLELNLRYNVLLFLSATGMGIWFSKNHNLFSKKNIFVWILFPIILVYMIAWDFFGFRLAIDGAEIIRGDYNYLTYLYSAFIFLIALKLIPQNPKTKIAKIFSTVSGATFHIYLVQDIYFSISYILHSAEWIPLGGLPIANILGIATNESYINFLLLIVNWFICISCGVLWWYIDKKIRSIRLEKKIN